MLMIPERGVRQRLVALVLAGWLGLAIASEAAALELGKAAPDFSLPSTTARPSA
jgi:hypothetical protein